MNFLNQLGTAIGKVKPFLADGPDVIPAAVGEIAVSLQNAAIGADHLALNQAGQITATISAASGGAS